MKWIKNTDKHPDAMLTFAIVAFAFVLIKFIVSGVTFSIGESVYSLGEIDASTVAAILTPTLGAYVARRHTDTKYKVPTVPPEDVLPDEDHGREA